MLSRPKETGSKGFRGLSNLVRRTTSSASLKSTTSAKPGPSSTKEVQDNSEQPNKSALTSKTDATKDLENEIVALKASLEVASAEVSAKRSAVESLEESKTRAERDLAIVQESLTRLQTEQAANDVRSDTLQQELEASRAAAAVQDKLVETLQFQIQALEVELRAAREDYDILQASSNEASVAATAAAEAERAALLKAEADLEEIGAEIASLKTAHAQAVAETEDKMRALQRQTARSQALAVELAELKTANDEKTGKVLELELAISQMKENQQKVEDENSAALARVSFLEEELANTAGTLQQIIQEAKKWETDYLREVNEVLRVREGLSAEIKKLSAEFESREAAYIAQAEALKIEHDQLLRTVRAESQATIARLNRELSHARADHSALVDMFNTTQGLGHISTEHVRELEATARTHAEEVQRLRSAHQAELAELAREYAALAGEREHLQRARQVDARRIMTLQAERDNSRPWQIASVVLGVVLVVAVACFRVNMSIRSFVRAVVRRMSML
ncbi:hypothetical protein AcW1_007761 [Taiwanofungus camphoratus]|nr:hypothetical protein AcW1_007761 [Antrodia cinnamomea]